MQITNNVLLIRPANFNFNQETAGSNAFQTKVSENGDALSQKAIAEFDSMVNTLREKGVSVTVIEDTPEPVKPDAIFPNNWISFHRDGRIMLYPMFAPNRRIERRKDIIEQLREQFQVKEVMDFSQNETDNLFLEGTGSIVFDHANKIGYACLSPRTNKPMFEIVCQNLGYKAISFHSHDQNGKEIYHTNVMMCVAEKFVVICMESITDPAEKDMLLDQFRSTGHEIIDIDFEQMNNYAGNMLGVKTKSGASLLVMSQSAFNSLNKDQVDRIKNYTEPLPFSIDTIETVGGGSVRCMIAENFLEPRT